MNKGLWAGKVRTLDSTSQDQQGRPQAEDE